MRQRKNLIILLALFFSMSTQISTVNAWEAEATSNDFGDKQFILATFFKSGLGAFPNKRPSGPHKQLGIACTQGYLEVGFFDIASSGNLLTIGSPSSMRVKIDGKLAPTSIAVNTNKGTDYVQANDAKALVNKLKLAKTLAVEMQLSTGYYRATFDIKYVKKYSSKFATAGCKI